ncbi:type III secretion system cytoplasmic ring protein SctQ [Luteimonas sp. MJ250]|uniref:type III secretion system cytoplasmic ring protein SctQ n=1 Tax=Luteimonas sp. MJ250 TaxID=3129236 RepID=UPI0031BB97B1
MATAERGARKARSRRTAPAVSAAAVARPVRGVLPAVDAASCEALRGFFAVPRWWLLGDGAAVQAAPGAAPPASFLIDAEGTRLALHVDGPASAGDDDARLRWSDHAGRARILAWSLAHETTLRRLSEWLGVSMLPALDGNDVGHRSDNAGEGEGDAGGAPSLWLRVHIDDEPADGEHGNGEHAGEDDDQAAAPSPPAAATTAWLRVPIVWLRPLAARAEPPYENDPPPDAGRWRRLPAPVSLLLPVTIPMRDWRALRPGDVLIAGHRGRPPACVARAAGRDWPLAPAPTGWTVHGQPVPTPTFREDRPMDENEQGAGTPPGTPPPAADPARSLPVQVEFELGRTTMSVGELADLQPGYVFALGAVVEGNNVTIRANGREAGRGELVAVGDTLGVRLLSWS